MRSTAAFAARIAAFAAVLFALDTAIVNAQPQSGQPIGELQP